MPPFHSNQKPESSKGYGNYILYHGNLSVSENIEVVEYLIKQFTGKKLNLIIAGKEPSDQIRKSGKSTKNIKIIANPSNEKMQDLIKGAHIILLPTGQKTGIKLKLIESLYKGRFCIANHSMIDDTMLEDCVHISENEFHETSESLMKVEFSEDDIRKRAVVLDKYYNNSKNAKLILEKIR